jgi:hypothetical protein
MPGATIPCEAWPLVIADTGVDRWSELFQFMLTPGVIKGSADDIMGQMLGNLQPALGVGLNLTIQIGRWYGKGQIGVLRTATNVPFSFNGATQDRIDRMVARIDRANNLGQIVVIEGTPSASPVPPAPVHSDTVWDTKLAYVTVPHGSSTLGTFQDEREYARPRGAVLHARIDGGGGIVGDGVASAVWLAPGQCQVNWEPGHFSSTTYQVFATAQSTHAFACSADYSTMNAAQVVIRCYDVESAVIGTPSYLNVMVVA